MLFQYCETKESARRNRSNSFVKDYRQSLCEVDRMLSSIALLCKIVLGI